MNAARNTLVVLLALSTVANAREPKKPATRGTPSTTVPADATPAELPAPVPPAEPPAPVEPPPPPPPPPWDLAKQDAARGDFSAVRALAPERLKLNDAAAVAEAARLLQAADAPRCEATPVVGLLLPYSGKYSKVAASLDEAIRTAYAHQGGNAPEVRLRPITSDGSPASAVAAISMAAADPCLVGVIGPLRTDDAAPVAAEAQRLGLPLVSLSAGHTATPSQPWVYSLAYSLDDQVRDLTAHAKAQGWKNVAILAPDSAYGRSVDAKLSTSLTAVGVTIAVDRPYSASNRETQVTDLTAFATAVGSWSRSSSAAPQLDAILLPDDAKVAAFAAGQLATLLPGIGDRTVLAGLAMWNKNELIQPWTPALKNARFPDLAPVHPPTVTASVASATTGSPTLPAAPAPLPELVWEPTASVAKTDALFFQKHERHATALELTAWDAGLLAAASLTPDVKARWQWAEAIQTVVLPDSPTVWRGFDPKDRTAVRHTGIWYASSTGFTPNP
jgi:hypothetical protein